MFFRKMIDGFFTLFFMISETRALCVHVQAAAANRNALPTLICLYTGHLTEKEDGKLLPSPPTPSPAFNTQHLQQVLSNTRKAQRRCLRPQTWTRKELSWPPKLDGRRPSQIRVVLVSGLPEIVVQLLALSDLCPDRSLQLITLRVRPYFAIRFRIPPRGFSVGILCNVRFASLCLLANFLLKVIGVRAFVFRRTLRVSPSRACIFHTG